MPKIALCLSGEPRDFLYIWNDYAAKIKFSQLDRYLHCYLNNGMLSNLPENPERGGPAYQALLKVVPTIEYLAQVQPKAAHLETYADTMHHRKFADSTRWAVERTGSMYHGIQATHKLLRTDLGYDLVVRSRPDLFFERPIDWDTVSNEMDQYDFDIAIPDLFINVGGGVGEGGPYGRWDPSRDFAPDLFWVAKARTLVYFQSIYDDFMFHCGRDVSAIAENQSRKSEFYWNFVAEWFLMSWIRSHRLRVGRLNFRLMTSRDHIRIFRGN